MEEYSILQKLKIRLGQYHMETADDREQEIVFDSVEEDILLTLLINTAKKDIQKKRNYPKSWNDEMILDDITRYEEETIELAMYDYNMQGAEFQKSHNEPGVSRSFLTKDEIMAKIIPFATTF